MLKNEVHKTKKIVLYRKSLTDCKFTDLGRKGFTDERKYQFGKYVGGYEG